MIFMQHSFSLKKNFFGTKYVKGNKSYFLAEDLAPGPVQSQIQL